MSAELIEDIEWIVNSGETHCEAIAKRVSRSPSSIGVILSRAGRDDLAKRITGLNTRATSKHCPNCTTTKPISAFYDRGGKRTGQLEGWCRECKDATGHSRPATVTKLVRNRARHRATEALIRKHHDEFNHLLDFYLEEATEEAAALETRPEITGKLPVGQLPRLKPGPRKGKPARLDPDWCPRCDRYHRADHTCASCGEQDIEKTA